jgi:hypothetical protein
VRTKSLCHAFMRRRFKTVTTDEELAAADLIVYHIEMLS